MQIQNVSGAARSIVDSGVNTFVDVDAVVEVGDKLGKRLLEQPDNWAEPKKVKGDKSNG